jgi:protein-S-isoprenylcysteine O-methyltransferase Ste14
MTWSSLRFILFIVGTALAAVISRRSLKSRHVHGFYRFFGFEALLFLVLANIPYWFREPFSILQVFSWILLAICMVVTLFAFYVFFAVGKPQGREEGNPNFWFENTANLVQAGPYKYIRHPMYGSLLFLGYGTFLKHISVASVIAIIIASITLYLAAVVEEGEDLRRFGPAYAEYMKKTKRFVPFVF